MFLIGRRDFGLDYITLRAAIARWFLMCVLTSRYTGSAETQVEKDIRRFAEATDGAEFLAILDQIIASQLTSDYWELTLPDLLAYSGGFIPAMFAYFAALNLLGAKVLFSNLTVHELLDPSQNAKKAATERHHLFPKGYLKEQGITTPSRVNQVANYALLEWPDNIKIGAKPPAEYFPSMFAERVAPTDAEKVRFWHALPDGWETMDYEAFLAKRRALMAQVIKAGYLKLSDGIEPFNAPSGPEPLPTVAELVAVGETHEVEFKSSLYYSHKPDIPEKVIVGSVLKTVAAFLNSGGGTLAIGLTDDGTAVGIGKDLELKGFDLDKFENALHTLIITSVGTLASAKCSIRFETVDERPGVPGGRASLPSARVRRHRQGQEGVLHPGRQHDSRPRHQGDRRVRRRPVGHQQVVAPASPKEPNTHPLRILVFLEHRTKCCPHSSNCGFALSLRHTLMMSKRKYLSPPFRRVPVALRHQHNTRYSISRNQSRTASRRRTTSSAAKGLQCAIGPRNVFRLAMTFSTAFALEKIAPNRSQLDLMTSLNSPNVV